MCLQHVLMHSVVRDLNDMMLCPPSAVTNLRRALQGREMVRGSETVLGDAASDAELFLTAHVQTWGPPPQKIKKKTSCDHDK